MGAGVALLVVLVIWLLVRRKNPAPVDRVALLESERTRLQEERDAEAAARKTAEETARKLEAELRSIAERKKARLEELDAETAKKFRDLSDDPDALLARLDQLLGRGDPTDPGA